VGQLKTEEERGLCRAILANNEEEFQRFLGGYVSSSSSSHYQSMKKLQEEGKQASVAEKGASSLSYAQIFQKNNKELSVVGKEILANVGAPASAALPGMGKELDKIIYEAKEESRFPKA